MPSHFKGLALMFQKRKPKPPDSETQTTRPRTPRKLDTTNRSVSEVAPGKIFSKALCEECEKLRLGPDRFHISANNHTRPQGSSQDSNKDLEILSGDDPMPRDTAQMNPHCPLCALIRRTILSYSSAALDPGGVEKCFLEWDLDGPCVGPRGQFENTTRRLKVSWTRKILLNGSDTRDVKEEVYLIHAPPASQDEDEYESCEELMVKWLERCDTRHDAPNLLSQGENMESFCKLVEGPKGVASRFSSFGVIDVVGYKLTGLPIRDGKPARFAALSYVWGPDSEARHENVRATRANNCPRQSPGGLGDEVRNLPRTIQDAIQLVRALGERIHAKDPSAPELRYLWVDLLCIVQDDPASWKQNASKMHLIYGNAYVTISAADGPDSDAGLAALDPHQRDAPTRSWIMPDLRLLVSKAAEDVIAASAWNRRAWTYQERILSRRCVVFAGRRAYFQCHETTWSQDEILDGMSGGGMASAQRMTPLRALGELADRRIRFFMRSVADYTGRDLGAATDVLNAYEVVAQLIEKHLCSDFVFGLPASHFDLALLWKPLAGKQRRTLQNLASTAPKQIRYWGEEVDRFPSWSWSGWMHYADPGKGAGVEYDSDLLAESLLDLRGWLLNHTWILWHVRDKIGYLRVLWNGSTEPMPGCRAAVWNGYKSRQRTGYGWWNYVEMLKNRVGADEDAYDRQIHGPAHRRIRDLLLRAGYERRDSADSSCPVTLGAPDDPMAVSFEEVQLDSHLRVPSGDEVQDVKHKVLDDRRDPRRQHNHPETQHDSTADFKPYQSILYFFTLRCDFWIVKHHGQEQNGLQKFHVADVLGDRCGTISLDKHWAEKQNRNKSMCCFIALSDAQTFSPDEWAGWTHYVPAKREDTDWPLFYVLMVAESAHRTGVWERVGLGKVFQEAFRINGCVWAQIVLG